MEKKKRPETLVELKSYRTVFCSTSSHNQYKVIDKVIDLCPNFRYMDTSSTFVWLFTNEHEQVLKKIGSFIEECFLLRGHN